MNPTNRLRFVRRKEVVGQEGDTTITRRVRILQQWWAPQRSFSDGYGYQTVELHGGEWRDIPLEVEQE